MTVSRIRVDQMTAPSFLEACGQCRYFLPSPEADTVAAAARAEGTEFPAGPCGLCVAFEKPCVVHQSARMCWIFQRNRSLTSMGTTVGPMAAMSTTVGTMLAETAALAEAAKPSSLFQMVPFTKFPEAKSEPVPEEDGVSETDQIDGRRFRNVEKGPDK